MITVAAQDRDKSIIENTSVEFSTYFGGEGTDDCDTVAVDNAGSIYLGCHLSSSKLPGSDKFPYTIAGGMDAFVIKLQPSGDAVDYITHLGGSEWDAVQGITTDADGNAYLVGTTYSANFPVTAAAMQTQFGGNSDAFVVKLNASGKVIWLSYFGSDGEEDGRAIFLDSAGSIHIVGPTSSANLVTTPNALQNKPNGGIDIFIASFSNDGKIIYSTYFGGRDDDIGMGITLDARGRRYITGATKSNNFPTLNPLTPKPVVNNDAFVTVLNPEGNKLEFSSVLGGSLEDSGIGIGLAPDGEVIIAGQTNSSDLPVGSNAAQKTFAGGVDAFVAKLNITKPQLSYLTYVGGSARERTRNLAIDTNGNAIIIGETDSPNFPATHAETTYDNQPGDGFLTQINPTGTQFSYSVVKGGSGQDSFEGVVIGKNNAITITGATNSPDFPTVSPLQSQFIGGRFDILVFRIHPH